VEEEKAESNNPAKPSHTNRHVNFVHHVHLIVGTEKREEIDVVEVVFNSPAWGWICSAWGATVSRILCDNLSLYIVLKHLHPKADLRPLKRIELQGQPLSDTDVIVSSCNSEEDLRRIASLCSLISAKIIMVAAPRTFGRAKLFAALCYNTLKMTYHFKVSSLDHSKVSGSTSAAWSFVVLTQHGLDWTPPPTRASKLPPTTIFNMIDDKIGGGSRVVPKRAWINMRSVHSTAWDLGAQPKNREYWVQHCPSVYSPRGNGIVRTLADHEIAAIWDYQLPDEDDMDPEICNLFLEGLLSGPPGKMIRKLTYHPLRSTARVPKLRSPAGD
jgi:hypothetical protein